MNAANDAVQRHPAIELVARYRAIFSAVWAARHELTGPARHAEDAAFLPAALSLQETPAHPAPRRVAFTVCALFVIAVVWATFGQIDIVAVAPGRIVVSERTKTLQPLEAGVVRRVLVKDGDAVKTGQVLVELDATNAKADGASLSEQLGTVSSEERRTGALAMAIQTGKQPVLQAVGKDAASKAASVRDNAQLQAEWSDITAKLAKLGAEQAHRQAELVTVRELIKRLEATLPIVKQREADFKSLTDQGFMSSHAGQDRTRERIEMEGELATQRSRLTAEVVVDNKDIGFVSAGLAVAIKLETFPFTRYGTIPASVKSVVADEQPDDCVFPMHGNRAGLESGGRRQRARRDARCRCVYRACSAGDDDGQQRRRCRRNDRVDVGTRQDAEYGGQLPGLRQRRLL